MNNKLKIAAAVTLLASGGMLFAACGKDKEAKDEYAGKIVVVSADNKKTTYDNWDDALENVKDKGTIELHKNVVLDDMEQFKTVSFNIDGLNKYSISASDDFTGAQMLFFGMKNDTATDLVFNIRNCKIDAKGKARAIKVDNSKLVLEGTTVTGGKVEASQGAGVVITGKSVFEMKSGEITGNTVTKKGETKLTYDQESSQDLWLGSEVNATISAGKIGKIFKNANKSGADADEHQGSLVQKGGEIEQVYVEFDQTYAATFTHEVGKVGTVLVRNSEGDGKETKFENPEAGKKYVGNVKTAEDIKKD